MLIVDRAEPEEPDFSPLGGERDAADPFDFDEVAPARR
jgi:hypothetical protein